MTQYTPSFRLWQGVAFDVSIKGAWGPPLNTNDNLLEAAITGTVAISLASPAVSPLTLSTANGAADQARNYVQQYTGAIAADFTVILPNVPKYGWAQNSTTGAHNVILDAGAGTNATIPPDGLLHFYWADGAGNVTLPTAVFGTGAIGPISGTTGTFSGAVSIAGTLTGAAANFSGNVTAANYGAVVGSTGTFSGAVSAASYGVVNGTTGSFSGALAANSIAANSGNVTTFGVINLSASTVAAGNYGAVNATNGVFSGSISIQGITASSVVNAGSLSQAGAGTGATGPVNYSLNSAGTVIASNYFAISDGRLKVKVEEITAWEAVAWVRAGRPVTFVIDGMEGAGFIAQEEIANGRGSSISYMEDTRPEVAQSDGYAPDGHRLLKNYEHDIAYLTKALQWSIARIDALEKER